MHLLSHGAIIIVGASFVFIRSMCSIIISMSFRNGIRNRKRIQRVPRIILVFFVVGIISLVITIRMLFSIAALGISFL